MFTNQLTRLQKGRKHSKSMVFSTLYETRLLESKYSIWVTQDNCISIANLVTFIKLFTTTILELHNKYHKILFHESLNSCYIHHRSHILKCSLYCKESHHLHRFIISLTTKFLLILKYDKID